MHVVFALLLSPLILLSSWVWIPAFYFGELNTCNDRTLVIVAELRRADALTCDIDLAGLVNGAPFVATFEGRPCGEFGTCLTPLLLHALEMRQQMNSRLAGSCGRVWLYHNHWDISRCLRVVTLDRDPDARWAATWAGAEATWCWLWKGLSFACCWVVLVVCMLLR